MLQHDLGAVHVRFDRVDRLFDDQLHAHRGGKMENHVVAVDQLREQRLVREGIDHVLEFRVDLQMADVADGPGRQVVDDVDLVARIQQCLGQVRPDKARASCNQRSHDASSFPPLVAANAEIAPATRSISSI